MQKYSAYKDSLFDWLGKIPAHWEEERAKWYFDKIDQRSETGEEELLSVSHITGVTPRSEKNVTMFQAESYEGHKLCQPGDLVINSMWAWMAALGVSRYSGIVSSAYGVYRPKSKQLFNPRYLDYLMRIKGYAGEYLCRSKGIWSSRLLLNPEAFFNIPIVHPPLEEQDAIVAFLEEQTAVINQFLTNKRQLIELLEEQKQVVINTAVTQGLDTAVARKPSGIDLLDDIPVHWSRLILRRCISKIEQGWSPQCFNWQAKPEKWGVLKVGAVNGGVFKSDENKELPDDLQPREEYEIGVGDFLVSRANSKELVGSAAVVNQVRSKLLLCDKLYRIRLRPDLVVPQFMSYVFATPFLRYQIESLASGSSDSMQNISQEKVKGLEFVLPSVNEQYHIIEHIEAKTAEINAAIERTQREIELIEEYRTTLIAHAVTGKIDVRNT